MVLSRTCDNAWFSATGSCQNNVPSLQDFLSTCMWDDNILATGYL